MDIESTQKSEEVKPAASEVMTDHLYDLLVLGGGPAGLNAAMYAARKGLDVAVLSVNQGGQMLNTALIENYLGIESIGGYEMSERFAAHLQNYSVPVKEEAAIMEYRPNGINHEVVLSSGETYRSKTVIIATGAIYRSLHVPGEYKYAGLGVSYCAICDAPLFRKKDVLVVGGGNSAVQAALDLAKITSSVTLIHRSQFRADKVLLDQLDIDPKMTVHLRTRIIEVIGDEFLSGVIVEDLDTGAHRTIHAKGLFIEIGQTPNIDPFKDVLQISEQGAIITDIHLATKIPGVFAAGNVREFPYKQIIIAAGEGAIAALSANDYIVQKYGKP